MIATINLNILATWQNTTGQTAVAEPDETSEPTGLTPPPGNADGLSPPQRAEIGANT
jgi:hypothetical protein